MLDDIVNGTYDSSEDIPSTYSDAWEQTISEAWDNVEQSTEAVPGESEKDKPTDGDDEEKEDPEGSGDTNNDQEEPPEGEEESWYNPDGSINYPPNNGAVPGTEVNITLKPGDTFGRYGEIGPESNFVTQPNADPNQLALPPNTDPSIYQEFIVIKEIVNVIQSEIASWAGSEGGGLQYELPMPILRLIEKGYIVPK